MVLSLSPAFTLSVSSLRTVAVSERGAAVHCDGLTPPKLQSTMKSSGLNGRHRKVMRVSSAGNRAVAVAEYRQGDGAGGFVSGFLVGGLVFGTLGFIFAPQLSKTLLGENADGTPRRLPRWMDEDDSLEATRKNLNEKIAQLNAAIDDVSAQLRADERTAEPAGDSFESA